MLFVVAALALSPPVWAGAGLFAAAIATAVLTGIRASRRARGATGDAAGVVLGTGPRGERVRVTDRQLSAHGLILGASGAGKSTTLLTILADHIERGKPVVAIDMKGSPAFARELAWAAAAGGRRFRVWTLDGDERWNPLQHGNATELKDKLIATERFTEPHYQRAAERYVQTVLQVLRETRHDGQFELRDVVSLMDPKRLSGTLRGLPSARAQQVQDYLAGLTPDQHSAIRGLGTRLAIITESHTGRFLGAGADVIDVRRALAGDEVVLFSLNSSSYGKLAAQIGTLAVQDLVSAAGHRLATGFTEPALVAIDEFSALGADHVLQLLARGREAGIPVLLATQELADLERAAPGFRDQVLGNTAVKLAHRQDVPHSAQLLAEMVGTRWEWEETRAIGAQIGVRGYGASRGTRRQVERYIVHPNEIKSLPTGQMMMLSKTPRASARIVRVTPRARDGPER
jgi:conjugal transfer pilus assembly protein TraD